MPEQDKRAIPILRKAALPLEGRSTDYDPLLGAIDGARIVLIGEASHGTHEFYAERARITRRLIEEQGFNVVAVEADWPDAYRVNRFVQGGNDDPDAVNALGDFQRFPTWMWRNADVVEFIDWLKRFNRALPSGSTRSVGFYGLDLYSLHSSIGAVVAYLEKIDPKAAARARRRYSCFEHFEREPEEYGFAASLGLSESCESEVIAQLIELQRRALHYARRDGRLAEDEYFFAEQNARLARNAERYYRAMYRGRVSSWNLRDQHMAETLDALVDHFDRQRRPLKAVIWAHNSHLGDARATEMADRGELNVGQLVRQAYGDEAFSIGFTTHTGTVTAADDWDAPPRRRRVQPALPGSYERLFHELASRRFLLILRAENEAVEELRHARLERAIGVIYRPETERLSHYFEARLPSQFDAVIHIDETSAVEPLEREPAWEAGELPQTYPSGV